MHAQVGNINIYNGNHTVYHSKYGSSRNDGFHGYVHVHNYE